MSQLKYWNGTAWETAVVGAQGPSGVISVTSPITNSGTSTSAEIGIDQTALTLAQSQVTNLETDLGAKTDVETHLSNLNQSSSVVDTIPRGFTVFATSGATLALGTIAFYFFTPLKTTTVSQMTMISGTAAADLTLARMGLYTFDGTTATLVAQTANDTTLFTSASTVYARNFDTAGGYPATYTLVAGQRYGAAVIRTGVTAGTLLGYAPNAVLMNQLPRVTAAMTSQTDLVATSSTFNSLALNLWTRFS